MRLVGVAVAVTGLASSVASAQVTIATVAVGNPGNNGDPETGFGGVRDEYRIGIYEVTNAQYVVFLNAKAVDDRYNLYNPFMGGAMGGIARTGSPGAWSYSVIPGRGARPVNYVSFWDACRFVNWLHNGQGSGDTETGVYTLTASAILANSVARNPGWRWAITSEQEWYKAAYYQPYTEGGDEDDYWLFPTGGNSVSPGQANYDNPLGMLVSVGQYAPNYAGTYDQGGNVWEWNESIIFGSARGLRGGSFDLSDGLLAATVRNSGGPADEGFSIGFRVSQSDEPPCPVDFDGSGFVDSDDFVAFADSFTLGCDGVGSPDPACARSADFDGSGFVDSDDFVSFVDAFNTGC
ncbi:MAG: SUMF1/EgtB/PvdO family nonheme iron enzyme [Planctomycetota bacterium]|nr:SUMF1/EgtB/PvdO family nonheme iron enzyme [Planctomycetota bacterium]